MQEIQTGLPGKEKGDTLLSSPKVFNEIKKTRNISALHECRDLSCNNVIYARDFEERFRVMALG